MRAWARRTNELHSELAAIAEVDPRWWLLAGAAAAAETVQPRAGYVASDADPGSDTFIGLRSPEPADRITDAIVQAHAARAALRELDGQLLDQPLAVTLDRSGSAAARAVPSALDVAAFAIGDQVIRARLETDVADEGRLAERLLAAVRGFESPQPPTLVVDPTDRVAFVCVAIGDEALSTARHGHRRAWVDGVGPWLGLGRSGALSVVSTCHMVVDGFGHAWLAAKIFEHHARLASRAPATREDRIAGSATAPTDSEITTSARTGARTFQIELPPLPRVRDVLPLGIAWREIPSPAPRTLHLAYALGRVLHRAAQRPKAKFSPTFQIPVAPGEQDDPDRQLRRVVPSAMSVRFVDGEAEAYEAFEARARSILAREAAGRGLCTRLLAAARAAPLSLAWKRRTMSPERPKWLDRIAEVVGGRASLSRIQIPTPMAPACAVSSPARQATKSDPLGSCVITVIDDGTRASITACGSGLAGTPDDAADLIDVLLDELAAVS